MLNQTMHKQKGNNQKYMCQNAFFPCLQGINMLRSKREEQKKDVYIQSRVQKKSDARVYRVQKKKKFMAQKNIKII